MFEDLKLRFKFKLRDWKDELLRHKKLIMISVLFVLIAFTLNFFAGMYVDKKVSTPVSDLILDHLPSIDLTPLFVYGYVIIFVIMFLYPLIFKVNELHEVITQFSLLLAIRSFFLILTHLQHPISAIDINDVPFWFSAISFKNDLFFSGHTAFAFLGFLLFRKHKLIRYFFLAMTFILGATVLLMHVHYSIDVFAAVFITYGSYKIGKRLLRVFNNNQP